jgi:uncharacterized phage-associated protein
MTDAKDIAKYFLKRDAANEIFTSESILRRGVSFTAGSARVNKYLHIAQNMWIAKTGKLLFSQPLLAFDNGAVVDDVRMNYNSCVKNALFFDATFPVEVCDFLDRIYTMLKNATIDELINLSHQDGEWFAKNKSGQRTKKEQEMDSISMKDKYKEQYADALVILERIAV